MPPTVRTNEHHRHRAAVDDGNDGDGNRRGRARDELDDNDCHDGDALARFLRSQGVEERNTNFMKKNRMKPTRSARIVALALTLMASLVMFACSSTSSTSTTSSATAIPSSGPASEVRTDVTTESTSSPTGIVENKTTQTTNVEPLGLVPPAASTRTVVTTTQPPTVPPTQ